MLLIAVFAVYAIVSRRVRITRNVGLSGTNARNYGIALLVLLLPVAIGINVVLSAVLPESVLLNPVASRLIAIALFGAFAVALAYAFRDKSAPGTGV